MSFMQRLLTSIMWRSCAAAMEAESRTWMARCATCSQERSVWELGGIRWKAAGTPRRRFWCPHCARRTWHQLRKA